MNSSITLGENVDPDSATSSLTSSGKEEDSKYILACLGNLIDFS